MFISMLKKSLIRPALFWLTRISGVRNAYKNAKSAPFLFLFLLFLSLLGFSLFGCVSLIVPWDMPCPRIQSALQVYRHHHHQLFGLCSVQVGVLWGCSSAVPSETCTVSVSTSSGSSFRCCVSGVKSVSCTSLSVTCAGEFRKMLTPGKLCLPVCLRLTGNCAMRLFRSVSNSNVLFMWYGQETAPCSIWWWH